MSVRLWGFQVSIIVMLWSFLLSIELHMSVLHHLSKWDMCFIFVPNAYLCLSTQLMGRRLLGGVFTSNVNEVVCVIESSWSAIWGDEVVVWVWYLVLVCIRKSGELWSLGASGYAEWGMWVKNEGMEVIVGSNRKRSGFHCNPLFHVIVRWNLFNHLQH